jgi:hypothetical protein
MIFDDEGAEMDTGERLADPNEQLADHFQRSSSSRSSVREYTSERRMGKT